MALLGLFIPLTLDLLDPLFTPFDLVQELVLYMFVSILDVLHLLTNRNQLFLQVAQFSLSFDQLSLQVGVLLPLSMGYLLHLRNLLHQCFIVFAVLIDLLKKTFLG